MSQLATEKSRRERECLRVYRPTVQQSMFHGSLASERILRGGKRSGKSLACAAEFASAVTGVDIIGPDGHPIPRKYPKRPMTCWLIGWDLAHIGQTIHRLLFQPGQLFVVKDGVNGEYRIWNPGTEPELAEQAVACEPMIPERFIKPKSWGWDAVAEKTFTTVTVNGPWGENKIFAFPSTGRQAKQGDAVDVIWIDEDVCYAHHVKEWQDRLSSVRGRMWWSAWPHGHNDALVGMSERAKEQVGSDNPDVSEVVLRFTDNPYIDKEEKRKSYGRMSSPEERRSRDFGEFLFDTIAMYDFAPGLHGIVDLRNQDPNVLQEKIRDPLNRIYTSERRFPKTWTRYLAIDPSHTRTAVLFAVVPPMRFGEDEIGNVIIIENELVLKRADTDQLALEVKNRIAGLYYEAFIMDQMIGRQTRIGSGGGQTVMYEYQKAFTRHGLVSRQTGSGFAPGSNDVSQRCDLIRTKLNPTAEGQVNLRFIVDKLFNTIKEFGTYRKKIMRDEVADVPANPRTHDCMQSMEYLVSFISALGDQAYVEPGAFESQGSPALKYARKLLAKNKEGRPDYCHVGPGSAA